MRYQLLKSLVLFLVSFGGVGGAPSTSLQSSQGSFNDVSMSGKSQLVPRGSLNGNSTNGILEFHPDWMEFSLTNAMAYPKAFADWQSWYAEWTIKERSTPGFTEKGEMGLFAHQFLYSLSTGFMCSASHRGCKYKFEARDVFELYQNDPELARRVWWTIEYYDQFLHYDAEYLHSMTTAFHFTEAFESTIIMKLAQQPKAKNQALCDSMQAVIDGVISIAVSAASTFGIGPLSDVVKDIVIKEAIKAGKEITKALAATAATYAENVNKGTSLFLGAVMTFTAQPMNSRFTANGMCAGWDGQYSPDNFQRLADLLPEIRKVGNEMRKAISDEMENAARGSFGRSEKVASGSMPELAAILGPKVGSSDLALSMSIFYFRGGALDQIFWNPSKHLEKPLKRSLDEVAMGKVATASGGTVICQTNQVAAAQMCEEAQKNPALNITRLCPKNSQNTVCQAISITDSEEPHITHFNGYEEFGKGALEEYTIHGMIQDVWDNRIRRLGSKEDQSALSSNSSGHEAVPMWSIPICAGPYVTIPDLLEDDARLIQDDKKVRLFPLICGPDMEETHQYLIDVGHVQANPKKPEWKPDTKQKYILHSLALLNIKHHIANPFERFHALCAMDAGWPMKNTGKASLSPRASVYCNRILPDILPLKSVDERNRVFCTENQAAKEMMQMEVSRVINPKLTSFFSHRRLCRQVKRKVNRIKKQDKKKEEKRIKQEKKNKKQREKQRENDRKNHGTHWENSDGSHVITGGPVISLITDQGSFIYEAGDLPNQFTNLISDQEIKEMEDSYFVEAE